MGSSLKAIKMMVDKYKKFKLVYAGSCPTSKHHDAFFIRNDLIKGLEVPKLHSFKNTQFYLHSPCKNNNYEIYIDYEIWLKKKDFKLANKHGKIIAKKYLCDNNIINKYNIKNWVKAIIRDP